MNDEEQNNNVNSTEDTSQETEVSTDNLQPAETTTPEAEPMPEPTVSVKERNKLVNFVRKPLVLAMLGLIIIVVGLLTYMVTRGEDTVVDPQTSTSQEKVTTLGATIASIEGVVEYSRNGADWMQASGGESLEHLDYVRTQDSSRAIMLFDDGSVARLDSNSELYLSSLQIDGLEITLVDGSVYSRVVESENQSFTVLTANERFKALGTAFKTTISEEKNTMEVYHSGVKVESQDLEVSEGNMYDSETKEQKEIDLALLDADEFAQWNKQKDSESNEFKDKLGVLADRVKEPAPVESVPVGGGITLSASQGDKGVNLSWTLNNVSSNHGFKIVRSKTDSTPSFGENDAQYVGDKSARNSTWHDDNGGTHYYRVCIYRDSGSCDTYSNSVQASSPLHQKEPVVSGAINLTVTGNKVSWSLAGGNAPHGFKVLLSTVANPTYPENSIKYTSDMSATLPEKPVGTYYVRVCKYTNGTQEAGCVDYSNQVEYVVSP